jgi:hypothetical protein
MCSIGQAVFGYRLFLEAGAFFMTYYTIKCNKIEGFGDFCLLNFQGT